MKKALERVKNFICPDGMFVLLLVVYAMRHVNWGLDLLDTGYSYINFQYMDMEHMDSMWLFSTYLANVIGNFILKLPFADKLLVQNIYTTVFVATLAVAGYIFCTKKLNMSRWVVLLGEVIALSLCWCPSSVLYNYMSYLLLLICVVFLYKGLTKGKNWSLFVAGICLGVNILTRFSNLPQMALIVAVWAYGVLEYIETKEKGAGNRTVNRTLWCLGGYLTGLLPLLAIIHFQYGLDEYILGNSRLFGMTEAATDYSPINMVISVLYSYYENIYWVLKIAYYVLIGMALCFVENILKNKIQFVRQNRNGQLVLDFIVGLICVGLTVAMVRNFYIDSLCSLDFYAYDSIRNPSILFMMLTMMVAFIKLIRKDVTREEKLIGIMIVLIIFISSIGSNNGIYSSMNNLFLVAPYTLWNVYEFIRTGKDIVFKRLRFSVVPIKSMLIGIILFYMFQTTMFGYTFFYTEAEGAKNVSVTVDNYPLLAGIKMSPDKAKLIEITYDYVIKNDLVGRESITVGHRPAIAYYLNLPPSFNAWHSLHSYSLEQMILDMEELQKQIDAKEILPPIIIASKSYPDYEIDEKWNMLVKFMKDNGYERTLEVEEYIFYEVR